MSKNKSASAETVNRWADLMESVLMPHPNGLTFEQVSVLSGMSMSATRKAMAASSKRGGAVFAHTEGRTCIWWHADFAEQVACMKRRRQVEKKRKNAEAKRAKNARAQDAKVSDFDRPSVHRMVCASNASRLRPAGPASVWGLAA